MIQEPILRDYRPEDFEQIKAIHDQMGLDYRMPNLGDPLFVVRKVLVAGDRVVAASVARVEFETYLWLDQELSAREKNAAMELLQEKFLEECRLKGAENVVAWIPEHVEAKFAKRLTQLGWSRGRDGWHSWSRQTTRDGK